MVTKRYRDLEYELQIGMTANAGVFRTKESLERQLEIIDDLLVRFNNIRIDDKSNTFNTDLQEAIELGHMLEFSKFIVVGALNVKRVVVVITVKTSLLEMMKSF